MPENMEGVGFADVRNHSLGTSDSPSTVLWEMKK